MKALGADGETDIPAEMSEAADAARSALVESVAECDDALLEKYLEEGELSDEEVARGLVLATRSRQVLPIFCGAATAGIGIAPLMAGNRDLLPSAADREPWQTTGGDPVAADPDAAFSAVVLKTVIDRYAGTLTLLRVISGTAQPDSAVLNVTREEKDASESST